MKHDAKEQMTLPSKRIEYTLPPVPHSLRGFIERVVQDERAYQILIESPTTALISAGVPIRENSLTESDCIRLIKVVDQLRIFLKAKKRPEEFRFENIFAVREEVSKTTPSEKTETCDYIEQHSFNFERKKECHDQDFKKSGAGWNVKDQIIHAPLLSPGDLGAILAQMNQSLTVLSEESEI